MIDLTGKVAVVFGLANKRSIAWAIAQKLSEAGARLAICYQSERLKKEAEALIPELRDAQIFQCDVSSDAEIEASTGYGALIEKDGFRPIEEARASRHRMRLCLPPGTDEEELFRGFQATLRQLVRGAEKKHVLVL